jgi:hypothetical protein
MRFLWNNIVRILVISLFLLISTIIILSNGFPTFLYASSSVELIQINEGLIGQKVSHFMWSYRLIDLIAQSFVLFLTATCCIAILSSKEEKK